MITRRSVVLGLLLLCLGPAEHAAARGRQAAAKTVGEGAPLDLAQWEPAIQSFEAADRVQPPPAGGIEFAGSSSIRLWTTLTRDFPGLPVYNRGFGGSQIREVTAFANRIVLPYKPRLIVFYCGTNDVAAGRAADLVAGDYAVFVRTVHQALPTTRIAFIAAAPNPARWHLRSELQELNRRVRAMSRADARLSFIDVWPAMLGADGTPRPELFIEDRLHMNANGYAIWKDLVGRYLAVAVGGTQPN